VASAEIVCASDEDEFVRLLFPPSDRFSIHDTIDEAYADESEKVACGRRMTGWLQPSRIVMISPRCDIPLVDSELVVFKYEDSLAVANKWSCQHVKVI
jgi:hypothetical protein